MFVMIFDHRNELFQKVLRDVETARSKRYVDQINIHTHRNSHRALSPKEESDEFRMIGNRRVKKKENTF